MATKAVDLRRETEIRRDVREFYERLGCIVAPTSHGRRNGTQQTPGIPDLYVFPMLRKSGFVRGCSIGCPFDVRPFWHEVKTPSGKQSPAQKEWQMLCEARGVGYVLGGTEAAIQYARAVGLLPR